MIPKRSGDRTKTDRRDVINQVRLYRAGELSCIYVPTKEDEAMRDLVRCRDDFKRFERKARQRLLLFLLRHGLDFAGKKNWTQTHMNWLAGLKLFHRGQQIVLQEYIDAVKDCTQRVERITEQIRQLVVHWGRADLVKAYQALRGVSLIVAVTVVAEIGDMGRFKNPKELMAYLGLVPSEHSSGSRLRRGAITKTGNGHVRRVLTEAAWAYRMRARKTKRVSSDKKALTIVFAKSLGSLLKLKKATAGV